MLRYAMLRYALLCYAALCNVLFVLVRFSIVCLAMLFFALPRENSMQPSEKTRYKVLGNLIACS